MESAPERGGYTSPPASAVQSPSPQPPLLSQPQLPSEMYMYDDEREMDVDWQYPDECPKAERFKKTDHVLCYIDRMIDEEEDGFLGLEDETDAWAPGTVIDVDMKYSAEKDDCGCDCGCEEEEGGDNDDETVPYGVVFDKLAEPRFSGKKVSVPEDCVDDIRAETCFSAGMARWAALPLPPPKGERPAALRPPERRFGAGAAVVCRVDANRDGTGGRCAWEAGTIAAVDAAVDGAPGGRGAAYRIELADGGVVFAARDAHWLVRGAEHQGAAPCESESIAGTRFVKMRRGEGKWVRFDHATARSCPCKAPGEDSDSDSSDS